MGPLTNTDEADAIAGSLRLPGTPGTHSVPAIGTHASDDAWPRLVMLPGLGCDGRLWDALRREGLDIECPPWIDAVPGESLDDYAARLAATLDTATPYCLGGSSFGGFIAQAMARHLTPTTLLLIATGDRGDIVRPWVRSLDPWLGWLPAPAFKPLCATVIGTTLRHERTQREHRELMFAMLRDTPAPFFKWAARAVLPWRSVPWPDLPCPVHHIHGRHDGLMPITGVQPTHVIDDGGHLINVTHPREVAAFLVEAARGE